MCQSSHPGTPHFDARNQSTPTWCQTNSRIGIGGGAPQKPSIDPLTTSLGRNPLAVVAWGHQVVVPGTKAGTTELPNEDLALAVIGRNDQLAY